MWSSNSFCHFKCRFTSKSILNRVIKFYFCYDVFCYIMVIIIVENVLYIKILALLI
jgi:hypothetical protein